jgi:hypothetical protein
MKIKPFIPIRLKVQTDDGVEFIETDRVFREPALQKRCLEKRELKRIMNILKKQGVQVVQPPRGPAGSRSTKRSR